MRPALRLLMVAAALVAIAACGGNGDSTTTVAPPPPPPPPPKACPGAPAGAITVINHDIGGSGKYEFEPADFEFSVGQEVDFCLETETEFHTFTVDDLDIDVGVDAKDSELFTFKFDRAGEFRLICSVHEQNGMTGTITIQ